MNKHTKIIAKTKFTTMNFATTKRRIVQFLDYQGVSVANFFRETEIKRGFLDSDKLDGAVTDAHFAKIIATYPSVNLHWLITGEGSMLIENEVSNNVEESRLRYIDENSRLKNELLQAKDEIIRLQQLLMDSAGKDMAL